MKKLKMTEKINFKLSDELSQKLNAAAEELGLNRSQVVRQALEKFVKEWKSNKGFIQEDIEWTRKTRKGAK